MKAFFSDVPPLRDWFYGMRTFIASMVALYIAMKLEMPRPYWAMATVYIVSSPFVGATTSKALYRGVGTFVGAAAAVFFVPLFVQTPFLLVVVVAAWTGTLLFLSLHLRTANSYALMLAGYTMPLIALPTVFSPLNVFDVASARFQEICVGLLCAAVVGAVFWPRRLAPVLGNATGKWFAEATTYSDRFLARQVSAAEVGTLRASMVTTFNTLELMIGQIPHEGALPQTVNNVKELRGRMIHLLPTIDALDDALVALERRTDLVPVIAPVLEQTRQWLTETAAGATPELWAALHTCLDALQPAPEALDDRRQLLLSNVLYRLGEWIDLWQDMRTLLVAIETEDQSQWRAVYRHWRLGRLSPFFDRGMMMYSSFSTIAAIVVASSIWIYTGWADGGGGVILAAVACSFFAAMDDPAPQIYRFFFWTMIAVVMASLYLFFVLPNLHDFPMLVLAFAVPFITAATLTLQPRFNLGMVLTLVNSATFISLDTAYDANFLSFLNSNIAGPAGLLFAFIWTLLMRPFGTELAAKRLTRFSWRDIVSLSERATLAQHRAMGVQMLDRLMQHLPRLMQTGQDTGAALRDLRVALNLLDLLAYMPRMPVGPRAQVRQVVDEVGGYFSNCLKARERLPAPMTILMTMDRARRTLSHQHAGENTEARVQMLHALSGLRLALLPGVEIVVDPSEAPELPTQGLDGAH